MFFELLCKSQQVRLRRRSAGGGLGLKNAYVIVERARTVRKLRRLLDDAGQQGQLVRLSSPESAAICTVPVPPWASRTV